MSGSMTGEVYPGSADAGEEAADSIIIPLSDPDITLAELEAIDRVMRSPRLSGGPSVEAFEAAFAKYLGRNYAVAVPSGTLGLLITLTALEIGRGHEVVAPSYSFRETAHAIVLAGAQPVFVDIDYWSGTVVPEKVEAAISEKTRAILAGNANGHPAQWDELRAIAKKHNLLLIEDFDRSHRLPLQGCFGRHVR